MDYLVAYKELLVYSLSRPISDKKPVAIHKDNALRKMGNQLYTSLSNYLTVFELSTGFQLFWSLKEHIITYTMMAEGANYSLVSEVVCKAS